MAVKGTANRGKSAEKPGARDKAKHIPLDERPKRAARDVHGETPSVPPPLSRRPNRILNLAAKHKSVVTYYSELRKYEALGAKHEGAVRDAFGSLFKHCAKQFGWTLINEYPYRRRGRHPAKVDGALVNKWRLARVFWEAKDTDDDLEREVKNKIADGYPTDNIIFQAPNRAIVYQNQKRVCDVDLTEPEALVDVLKLLFRYEPPSIEEWEQAADEFGDKVPELAQSLVAIITAERKQNPTFLAAFQGFCEICRTAINPEIGDDTIENMLVQHLLTERIFRKVFNNPDFSRRNVIAVEIEKVIQALTSRAFNRDQFLVGLERFYATLEKTASTIDDYTQKQSFLNRVYERFFQGFDEKAADTHGIVYTPQPLVRFMTKSVDALLQKEFGKTLADDGVHVIDPFVGTGNFLLNIMRSMPKTRLPKKYRAELHANEIMLLPYYIAAMNIEHEYASLTGTYEPFEGLCLVDTFELAEPKLTYLSEANSRRVERQKKAPIFVIVGNPPYNAWQIDENDKNKNRKYRFVDDRISETYAKDSKATLKNSLSDPYVKAFVTPRRAPS